MSTHVLTEFDQVTGGVRSDLIPNQPPGPEGYTGEGTPHDEPESDTETPADFTNLPEMLALYRGRPEPFLAGTFAAYSAPDGSVVVVTEIPGRGVEQHQIPSKVIKLALSAASGKGPFGKMFGRG